MGSTRNVMIGGPGTRLPFFIESLLSWALCLSCLGVSGYHFLVNTYINPWLRQRSQAKHNRINIPFLRLFIPLTTYSRSELSRLTPIQRYHQLIHLLEALSKQKIVDISIQQLVELFKTHGTLRRLATLTLRPYPASTTHVMSRIDHTTAVSSSTSTCVNKGFSTATSTTSNLFIDRPDLPLLSTVAQIWPQLLILPTVSNHTYNYEITCIVPSFCESAVSLCKRLERALHVCKNPTKVEVIIVDAGGGTDDFEDRMKHFQNQHNGASTHSSVVENRWGHVSILSFSHGGGRGPTLNYGATVAQGRILTFCHSDAALPPAWDSKIIHCLDSNHTLYNACAFSFGIDTTMDGLNGGLCPPGIKAVETTANIRTHLYSLPYGDQVLSMKKVVFDYLGGFPDQCLMEDYEIVALLRKRASLLPKLGISDKEVLGILEGEPVLCSPRRWQRFGVLYVTLMNSRFVNKYAGGLDPDELYRKYYGQDPPTRKSPLSPWELDMKGILGLQ